jgi:acetyltransferase-like isoleucine patch superfamily enzyme
MMRRLLTGIVAATVALPYRVRCGRMGRRARILPPLLLRGASRVHLGDDVRTEAFAAISAGAAGRVDLGDRCEVGAFARIDADQGHVRLGSDSSVNAFCMLNGYGGLDIGRAVRIASHTVVLSSTHRYDDPRVAVHEQGIEARPTSIGDGAWLGAHVVVVGGVSIGANSIVGAGTVVTDDVPPWAVVAGVPARVIRDRRAAAGREPDRAEPTTATGAETS